jgi:hypothetical protein
MTRALLLLSLVGVSILVLLSVERRTYSVEIVGDFTFATVDRGRIDSGVWRISLHGESFESALLDVDGLGSVQFECRVLKGDAVGFGRHCVRGPFGVDWQDHQLRVSRRARPGSSLFYGAGALGVSRFVERDESGDFCRLNLWTVRAERGAGFVLGLWALGDGAWSRAEGRNLLVALANDGRRIPHELDPRLTPDSTDELSRLSLRDNYSAQLGVGEGVDLVIGGRRIRVDAPKQILMQGLILIVWME